MKFIYNCKPLFITVFLFIESICTCFNDGSACVIKFTFKSSIFVSTETKYVSQIHLDVSRGCGLSAGTFQKGAVNFSEFTLLWKPSLADPLSGLWSLF